MNKKMIEILSRPKKDTKHLDPYKWKKGQTPNPGGKPKGATHISSFKQLLEKIGNEDVIDSPIVPRVIKKKFFSIRPITMKHAAMWIVYLNALSGKDWALKFIVDYTEGKPKEFHEIFRKTINIDIENENELENEILEEKEILGTDDNNDSCNKIDNDNDNIDYISNSKSVNC